jgi:hypothetical protein
LIHVPGNPLRFLFLKIFVRLKSQSFPTSTFFSVEPRPATTTAAEPPIWKEHGELPSMGGHGEGAASVAAGSPPWKAQRGRGGLLHGRAQRGHGGVSSMGGCSEGMAVSPPWEGAARARPCLPHGRAQRGRGVLSSMGGLARARWAPIHWRARPAILLRIGLANSPFPEQQGDRMISVNA